MICLCIGLPGNAAAPALSKIQQLGPLRLNMSETEVDAALGKFDSEGKPVAEAASGVWIKHRRYERWGVTLTMSRVQTQGTWQIARFTASKPCPWKTPQGIGLGSSARDVRRLYRSLIDEGTTSPRQIVVGSLYDGVVFSLDRYKVTSIFMGAAAE